MSPDRGSLEYRPNLDGVRAFAVLLVFFYHIDGNLVPGGFIGVDVFFVLSGYLITRVILSRLGASDGFSYMSFYARRARRLLPAMFLLVGVVAVREALWGSILEASFRAREVAATLLYVSNWNFIAQSHDYFATEAGVSPLRHTWSLAVEEQFYIIFPIVLVVAVAISRKRKDAVLGVLIVLSLISIALAVYLYAPSNLVRVYFGTDTRAHQLLIGAVLGVVMHRRALQTSAPHPLGALFATWGAPLGLLTLLAASLVWSGSSSRYFLGGTVGVALASVVLFASLDAVPTSPTSRLLSWRPLVGLGRISYGFYLWHWPVILWLAVPDEATPGQRLAFAMAQFLVTLAITMASYRLVEMPVRDRRGIFGSLGPRPVVALGLGTSLAMALVLGAWISPRSSEPTDVALFAVEGGAENRRGTDPEEQAPDPSREIVDETRTSDVEGGRTFRESDRAAITAAALSDKSYEPCPHDPRPCVKVETELGRPTVALIGDSTAQAYDPALKAIATEYGLRYVQGAVGGCPIGRRLLATGSDGELHKESNFRCWEAIPEVYSEILDEWSPELVIAASWNELNQHVVDGELLETNTEEHIADVEAELRKVVAAFESTSTIAFIHILPSGPSVDCLDESEPNKGVCSRTVSSSSVEVRYNAIFDKLAAENPKVVSFSLSDIVCPGGECPLIVDGIVMRYDPRHLTRTASILLAPAIAENLATRGVDLGALHRSG